MGLPKRKKFTDDMFKVWEFSRLPRPLQERLSRKLWAIGKQAEEFGKYASIRPQAAWMLRLRIKDLDGTLPALRKLLTPVALAIGRFDSLLGPPPSISLDDLEYEGSVAVPFESVNVEEPGISSGPAAGITVGENWRGLSREFVKVTERLIGEMETARVKLASQIHPKHKKKTEHTEIDPPLHPAEWGTPAAVRHWMWKAMYNVLNEEKVKGDPRFEIIAGADGILGNVEADPDSVKKALQRFNKKQKKRGDKIHVS